MSDRTAIAWTDATWNPIRARLNGHVGWHCTRVSAGCENCYAEAMNLRLGTGARYIAGEKAELYLDYKVLTQPFRWRLPRRIFTCSMSDLFHEQVPDKWIDSVFAVTVGAPRHRFQILTKRASRMCEFTNQRPILKNLWSGVSIENHETAKERIPSLLAARAMLRFLSIEPLLGLVDLRRTEALAADWIIVGGESGPNRRPCKVEWIRAIADQCQTAGVPVFVKQDSALRPGQQGRIPDDLWVLKQFPKD